MRSVDTRGLTPSRLLRLALLAVLALATTFPLVVTVTNAFLSEAEATRVYGGLSGGRERQPIRIRLVPERVSLRQFTTVLVESPRYLVQFWNSVFLAVPIVAGQLVVGSLAAYAFAILRFKGRDQLFFLYIVTMLMPFQVTLVPNFMIADALGLIGHRSSIILPGIFQTFGVFLLRQFMAYIPEEVVQAGIVDGAHHGTIFARIVLPLSTPGLASLGMLLFIDTWNMVEQPIVFLRDAAMHPLSVYLSQIQQGRIGVAFAAAVVYSIPMLLVFLYGERRLVQGIQLSGIRG